ncbi:Type-1 restriction enzyme MjaXIP specificity protein [uncultured archaeon]|nr:Type-1 restriction enzyme MjaXIP specificity protein [uncultured archaeon]
MKQELISIQKNKLPEGWHVYKMEDVCDLKTGGTPSKSRPEYFGGNIKWIVSGDINKEFIYDVEGRITELGLKDSNARLLPIDSVLIALNGQGKTRGTVAVLKTEATCNQSIIAFIPKNRQNLDYIFLFYYLKNGYQKLRNLTGDNERSGLSMRVLRPLPVIVPPIDTQRIIIDKLEKQMAQIDIMRKELGKQLDSTERLFEIYLNEIFHFKLNGDLPADWKWRKLSEVTEDWKEDIVSGPFGSNLVVADYKNEGVPIIRLQNIQRMKFINSDIKYITPEKAEELKRHSYNPEDIVIAKLGIPVGKACKIPDKFEKGILVADVVRVRVNKTENDVHFMEYLLNSNLVAEQLNSKIIGSTRPRVNLYDVRDLILPVPSKLEQQKIASKLDKQTAQIEIMKNEAVKQLKAVNQLPASILNEVFGQYQINS